MDSRTLIRSIAVFASSVLISCAAPAASAPIGLTPASTLSDEPAVRLISAPTETQTAAPTAIPTAVAATTATPLPAMPTPENTPLPPTTPALPEIDATRPVTGLSVVYERQFRYTGAGTGSRNDVFRDPVSLIEYSAGGTGVIRLRPSAKLTESSGFRIKFDVGILVFTKREGRFQYTVYDSNGTLILEGATRISADGVDVSVSAGGLSIGTGSLLIGRRPTGIQEIDLINANGMKYGESLALQIYGAPVYKASPQSTALPNSQPEATKKGPVEANPGNQVIQWTRVVEGASVDVNGFASVDGHAFVPYAENSAGVIVWDGTKAQMLIKWVNIGTTVRVYVTGRRTTTPKGEANEIFSWNPIDKYGAFEWALNLKK